jgi:hypothetical protein
MLVMLAGCKTVELPANLSFARPGRAAAQAADLREGTIIETEPTDATILHPGGECRTPCRVQYPGTIEVVIGKEGYRAVNLLIPEGAADAVIALEPVGRTIAVEEETLPLL